ncbi:MAG TPA: hypothetical protein VFD91_16890 [Mariniphaga sp.]|nr:hypothetical protein [Mariniphaga sp.]
MNRKEFIRSGGRVLILGGMALSTGYLFARKKVDLTCSSSSACKECSELSACKLPKAKELKDGKK